VFVILRLLINFTSNIKANNYHESRLMKDFIRGEMCTILQTDLFSFGYRVKYF